MGLGFFIFGSKEPRTSSLREIHGDNRRDLRLNSGFKETRLEICN